MRKWERLEIAMAINFCLIFPRGRDLIALSMHRALMRIVGAKKEWFLPKYWEPLCAFQRQVFL